MKQKAWKPLDALIGMGMEYQPLWLSYSSFLFLFPPSSSSAQFLEHYLLPSTISLFFFLALCILAASQCNAHPSRISLFRGATKSLPCQFDVPRSTHTYIYIYIYIYIYTYTARKEHNAAEALSKEPFA